MQLIVSKTGSIRCVYDEIIPLASLGSLTIARGSHVEPSVDGKWYADLSPVQGPNLGPFCQRSEALAAERMWLEAQWLSGK